MNFWQITTVSGGPQLPVKCAMAPIKLKIRKYVIRFVECEQKSKSSHFFARFWCRWRAAAVEIDTANEVDNCASPITIAMRFRFSVISGAALLSVKAQTRVPFGCAHIHRHHSAAQSTFSHFAVRSSHAPFGGTQHVFRVKLKIICIVRLGVCVCVRGWVIRWCVGRCRAINVLHERLHYLISLHTVRGECRRDSNININIKCNKNYNKIAWSQNFMHTEDRVRIGTGASVDNALFIAPMCACYTRVEIFRFFFRRKNMITSDLRSRTRRWYVIRIYVLWAAMWCRNLEVGAFIVMATIIITLYLIMLCVEEEEERERKIEISPALARTAFPAASMRICQFRG